MRFGLGYGIDVQRRQDPLRPLFASSEQGFVYDLYDAGTIFQDAAGTTPWTTLGQPVGLILDKRLGLVLGAERWADGSTSFFGESSRVSPNAYRIYSSSGDYSAVSYASGQTTGKWHEATFTIDSITVLGGGVSVEGTPTTAFTTTGRKTCRYLASSGNIVFKRAGSACDIQISNISVRELPGNHAYQTTPTARPVLDVNAAGYRRLKFDGIDDFLVTNSIDFTGTGKMTVWAGVRKLSDAATAVVCELSASTTTNNGTFYISGPESAGANKFTFLSKGTISASATILSSSFNAPVSAIVTGIANISGDISRIRVNGATIATTTTDQGTGNFGNYPLYIGRRGGTSLPFNGELYSPIVVRGAASSDGQIRMVERLINGNMGGGFL